MVFTNTILFEVECSMNFHDYLKNLVIFILESDKAELREKTCILVIIAFIQLAQFRYLYDSYVKLSYNICRSYLFLKPRR